VGQKPDAKGKRGETAATAKDKGKDNEPEGVWLAHDRNSNNDSPNHTTFDYAVLASMSQKGEAQTELFDSGTSRHMSSYLNLFQDFINITPKPITTADKHTFKATGKGNILITLPNGQSHTRILLKDVLYAPKMGLTLVSISHLTAAGYAVLFHENSYKIYDRKKKQLTKIPVSKGLYCMKAPRAPFAGLANTKELLSMQEIHMRLAHMPYGS